MKAYLWCGPFSDDIKTCLVSDFTRVVIPSASGDHVIVIKYSGEIKIVENLIHVIDIRNWREVDYELTTEEKVTLVKLRMNS